MDNNFLMKMLSKNLEQNPALQQMLTLKSMLDKLPVDKQQKIVGDFVKELEDAVKEQEEK